MTTSQELFARAQRVIPGGVNSPVRAFGAVGGTPVYLREGRGCRVIDAEGREYIDLVGSWGPLIAGHSHPRVIEAVSSALRRGSSFGAPTEAETVLAELIVARVPGIEKVRLLSSGTEATMTALRLARGFTGRDRLVKFAGCYHGHADSFLIAAGSGALTFGVPSSPGVPRALAELTLVAPFNDLDAVARILDVHGRETAAVILEPVVGNMGTVPPRPGFLAGLRALCDRHGALLIFDEVMTGFRVASGGAQERYSVLADLTTLGKIVGGGLPLAAVGGRADIMDLLAPNGPVYQAGTLSGNPLATAAGVATLELLAEPGVYEALEDSGRRLEEGLLAAIAASGVIAVVERVASMFTLFFTRGPIVNLDSLAGVDTRRYAAFFHGMLRRGVYLPPSQYEAAFLSTAHAAEDLSRILEAAREALRDVARGI